MKYTELVRLFGERPFFESRELTLLFEEPDAQVQARLARWQRQGKLVQLRRGRYLLPDGQQRARASVFYIANYLYRPSYVSLQSALEHYGMIPEAVGATSSVTPRHGREWQTPIGTFRYRAIRADRFWGYREDRLSSAGAPGRQDRFFIADPEKAILDLVYLDPGEWTRARLDGLRLQNLEAFDTNRMRDAAERFASPKVQRAAERLIALIDGERSTP